MARLLCSAAVLIALGCDSGRAAPAPAASATVVLVGGDAHVEPRPLVASAEPDAALPEGKIQARHLVVGWAGLAGSKQTRTKEQAKARAEEALAKLRGGADFAEIARTYGEDATRLRGGDLGVFGRSDMVAPFSDAAFALKPGEISGVVETDFGYHVIQRVR